MKRNQHAATSAARKIWSVILAAALVIGVMPVQAIADDAISKPFDITEEAVTEESEQPADATEEETASDNTEPKTDGEEPGTEASEETTVELVEPTEESQPSPTEPEEQTTEPEETSASAEATAVEQVVLYAAPPQEELVFAEEQLYEDIHTWSHMYKHSDMIGHDEPLIRPWLGTRDNLNIEFSIERENWVGLGEVGTVTLIRNDDWANPYELLEFDATVYEHSAIVNPMEATDEEADDEPISTTKRSNVYLNNLRVENNLLEEGAPFSPDWYQIVVDGVTGQRIVLEERLYIFWGASSARTGMWISPEGPYEYRMHLTREGEWYDTRDIFLSDRFSMEITEGLPPMYREYWEVHELLLIPEYGDYVEGIQVWAEDVVQSLETDTAYFHGITIGQERREEMQTGEYRLRVSGMGVDGMPVYADSEPFMLYVLQGMEITRLPDKLEYTVGEWADLYGLEVAGDYGNGMEMPLFLYNHYVVEGIDEAFAEPGEHTITLVETGGEHNLNRVSASFVVTVIDPSVDMEEAFPDAGWRAAVYDALGKTPADTVTERDLHAVVAVNGANRGIADLQGLEYLTGLEVLNLDGNALTEVSLGGCGTLREVSLAGNGLISIALPRSSALKTLDVSDNRLTSLAISGVAGLEELRCADNELATLVMTYNPSLWYVDCSNNRIATFSPHADAALREVDFSNNALTTMSLQRAPRLESLDCSNNRLTTLTLSAGASLRRLNCGNNSIEVLDLSGATALEELDCSGNLLVELDIRETSLQTLDCHDNYLPSQAAVAGIESVRELIFEPQHRSIPSAPGAPVLVERGTLHISMKWEASEDRMGIERYDVYRNGGAMPVASVTEPAYIDRDVAENTAYTYQIVAVSQSGGASEPGEEVTLSTASLEFYSHTTLASAYCLEGAQPITVEASARAQSGYDTNSLRAVMRYGKDGAQPTELVLTHSYTGTYMSRYGGQWDISGLEAGTYGVEFSFVDSDGTELIFGHQSVRIRHDDVPPEVRISGVEEGRTYGVNAPISVTGTASDDRGLARVILEYAVGGSDAFVLLKDATVEAGQTGYAANAFLPMEAFAHGETYNIRLRLTAYDLAGNTAGQTVQFILDAQPPRSPEALVITPTNRYLHLNWRYQPVDPDLHTFRIYRAQTPDGAFEPVDIGRVIGYYDDATTGVETGKTYFYYVTAVDAWGNESEPTATVSAALIADTEGAKIAAYLPAQGAKLCKQAEIVVSASDNYRLAQLELSYRLVGAEEWIAIADVAPSETVNRYVYRHWWDCSALPSGEYEIRMAVHDDTGNEPDVRIVPCRVAAYTEPATPVLTAESGHKQIALNWSYDGDEDLLYCYRLYRTAVSDGAWALHKTFAKSTHIFTDIVANDVEYQYKLAAVDIYSGAAESVVVPAMALADDNEPPVAVIQPEKLVAAVGQPFTFSGAQSTDNDRINLYIWNFGDDTVGYGSMPSHTYAEAGTYPVTLTVQDDSGNQGTATAELEAYDVAAGDTGYTLATFRVVDASREDTPALGGATVLVKAADGTEQTAATGADGVAAVLLENGSYAVSVTYSGFLPRTFPLTVDSDDGVLERTVGLSTASLVTGDLTVTEMTYEEIVQAGIDVDDPNNQHVSKVEVTFEFTVGDVVYDLPVAYYKNAADAVIHSSGGYSGEYVQAGELTTGDGVHIAVYPVSERFFLVVYGEARWLKEMYHVELVVINNSYTDTIEDCVATLELPDGLSLAGMVDRTQSLSVDMGDIGLAGTAANTAAANWYVRGDAEGEYYLSATVEGVNMPTGDPFSQTFTTDKPVKVYAGSALKLIIEAEDTAYRGEDYHVRFELQNVSPQGTVQPFLWHQGGGAVPDNRLQGFLSKIYADAGGFWRRHDSGRRSTAPPGKHRH
ncbi:PKD domain-containing protein [Ruminococcaceae bacterium OttesenSCG-928-L11]|nr:PKD domain-containing protein [Ruminococcaceae bacterium OttesenSCG-928-L11]